MILGERVVENAEVGAGIVIEGLVGLVLVN